MATAGGGRGEASPLPLRQVDGRFCSAGRRVRLALIAVGVLAGCILPGGLAFGQDESRPRTPRVAKAWAQTLSVTWDGVELGAAVEGVSRQQGVPVLLDRRIDRSRRVSLTVADKTVRELLEEAVVFSRAESSLVGEVLYLGPPERARWLRSVVEVRSDEFSRMFPLIARKRRPLVWEDVSEPAELVATWAREAGVTVRNLAAIPHDLWPAFPATETVPELSFVEGASLLLVGFDLVIAWQPDAATPTVELVPFPDRVDVTRRFPVPRGQAAGRLVDRARVEFSERELDLRSDKTQLVATGRVEHLEELERWLAEPGGVTRPGSNPVKPVEDINAKRFTLAIKDVPLKALLETLSKNPDAKLVFDVTEPELANAGVMFDRRISIDVKAATVDELLAAIGKELGLTFEREGRRVRVK